MQEYAEHILVGFKPQKRASATRMLAIKDGSVATLSAKDGVATLSISLPRRYERNRSVRTLRGAKQHAHAKCREAGEPFPAQPYIKKLNHTFRRGSTYFNKNQYPPFCCQRGFLYISFCGIGARYLSLRLPDVLIAFSLSLRAAMTCGSNCSRTMSNQRMPNSPANS